MNTPLCRCSTGEETPAHLVIYCPELEDEREELRALLPQALRTTRDFAAATTDPSSAKLVVKWLLATGRLPEYRRGVPVGMHLSRNRKTERRGFKENGIT